MNKYYLLVVVFFVVLPCTAQDTVKWNDPWYLFNQKPVHTEKVGPHVTCGGIDDYSDTSYSIPGKQRLFEQKYFFNKSRPVYGIAITACFGDNYPPIVYLYQQDSNGVRSLVDSIVQASNNIKDCHFIYEYFYSHNAHFFNYSNPLSTPYEATAPCVELYFDTPINAEDTIVVGLNPNNHDATDAEDYGRIYCVWDPTLLAPGIYMSFSPMTGWIYDYNSASTHGMLFPIVELRCRGGSPVPRVEEKGDGWARVSWPPDYVEEDYMVGVGRYGTEPADSLTFVVPRGDTSFTIMGLENGYPYGVWVKRGCRYAPGGYDTVVWGDWGRYTSLYLPPDTTGILAADESGELKVYPNPAHTILTVDLSEVNDDVAELTLSDLGGREVLRAKAERPLTKVDVGALPAGLYLLQAASPGKVYRRRVAVE